MSEDMSPYYSVHDEWLIMKLCMYVGYHDANNVYKNVVVTQLNLRKRFKNLICHFVYQNVRSAVRKRAALEVLAPLLDIMRK